MSYYPIENVPNPSCPSLNPSIVQYINSDIVLTSEPTEGDTTSTSVTLDQGFIEFRHTDNLNTSYVLTLSDRGLVTSQFGNNTRYSQGEIVSTNGIGLYAPSITFDNDPAQTITSFVSPVALSGKLLGEVGQVFTSNGANQISSWTDKGSVSVPNLTLNDLTFETQGDALTLPIKGTIDTPSGLYPPPLEIGSVNAPSITLGSTTSTLQIKSQLQDSTGVL